MAKATKNNVVTLDMSANAENTFEIGNEEIGNAETIVTQEEGKAAFFAAMEANGVTFGLSMQGKFDNAMRFQDAVRAGYVSNTPEVAKEAVSRYRSGIKRVPVESEHGSLGIDDTVFTENGRSIAAGASDLLTYAFPVPLKIGRDLYKRIDAIIAGYSMKDLNAGSKGKLYEFANKRLNTLYLDVMDIDATVALATDDYLASLLIKRGAAKTGDGQSDDGDGANGDGATATEKEKKDKAAKATPLEQLDLLATNLKKLVEKEYAGSKNLKAASVFLLKEVNEMKARITNMEADALMKEIFAAA
jgi:hypothetical protein